MSPFLQDIISIYQIFSLTELMKLYSKKGSLFVSSWLMLPDALYWDSFHSPSPHQNINQIPNQVKER